MLLFLSMVSLLIRAIVANPEIDDGTSSDITMHENGNNHMITIDNRTRQFLIDISKIWKGESLTGKKRSKENSDPSVAVSADSSQMKLEEKRRETVDSWLDFPRQDKVSGCYVSRETFSGHYPNRHYSNKQLDDRLTISDGFRKGFPIASQGRTNPWLYWWADKRLSLHRPSFSNIRRPIRVPFNSWGGKRTEGNVDLQAKRNKVMYERSDQDTSVDVFNGVKRVAEMGKIRWNSWGGKRADRSAGRKQFLLLLENPKDSVLDITKGQLYLRHHRVGDRGEIGNLNVNACFQDDNDDDEVGSTGKGRNTGGDKHVIQTKNGISAMDGWNWNGKRADTFPYPISFYHTSLYNDTGKDDYTMVEEITNDNDWWLTSVVDKRSKQDKQYFDPWGGKRSLNTYTFRYGNKYLAVPAYSAKGEKAFFP